MSRILFLTDLHGASVYVQPFLKQEPQADVVLLGGDLTNFGRGAEAAAMVEPLRGQYRHVLGVHGNVDHAGVLAWLEAEALSLHGRGVFIGDIGVYGCGGSNRTPLHTPSEYEEQAIARVLGQGRGQITGATVHVVISHAPPMGTGADLMFAGKHVGSTAVRALLAEHWPALCLCGHIHEAACVESFGRTTIVNPGPFAGGHYAVVELAEGRVNATLRRVQVDRATHVRATVTGSAGKLVGFARHRWGQPRS
ncbi:MAG: metallophosphoesterase family protein [Polyangiaceae bacterium]|nr:metallophosphoesterase family protein [Polyangiaceae bacterium]